MTDYSKYKHHNVTLENKEGMIGINSNRAKPKLVLLTFPAETVLRIFQVIVSTDMQ